LGITCKCPDIQKALRGTCFCDFKVKNMPRAAGFTTQAEAQWSLEKCIPEKKVFCGEKTFLGSTPRRSQTTGP